MQIAKSKCKLQPSLVPTLCVGTHYSDAPRRVSPLRAAERRRIPFPRRAWERGPVPSRAADRRGGVYVAVLGTSLIVALLGLSALMSQRIQNRMLVASADIAQAKLNADSAIELGLLTCKQNNSWRSLRDGQSYLYTGRSTGDGSCSLLASDAPSDAADAADRPFTLVGIGYHGPDVGDAPRTAAEQRAELAVDPRRQPQDFLKQTSSATPDWPTILAYYQTNGTQITVSSLSDRTPTFSRNPSFDDGHSYWTINFPDDYSDFRGADDSNAGAYKGHTACLHVDRNDWREGAANRLNATFLKPNTSYNVSIEINPDFGVLTVGQWTPFRITLILEFPDGSTALSTNSISQTIAGSALGTSWTSVSGTLQTPNWSQHPAAVYLVVNSQNNGNVHKDFYLDNLDFYESGARFIYQRALGPGRNPFGAQATNANGIYYIDCQNTTKLVIERSRIFGTLLVINPAAGSRVAYGPYHWMPAVAGYPTLLVNGNFTIQGTVATDTRLRELENLVNYNRSGVPHRTFGIDDWNDGVVAAEVNDYDSEIRGLVGISGDVTYQFSPPIRGKVLVGGSVAGTPAFEYRPDSLLSPPPPLGGFYTYRYDRRPNSTRKVVLP